MRNGKTIGAVVLAAGQGKRMNSAVQKQYMMLAGRPLLTHTLEAFECSQVDRIVVVTGAGEQKYVKTQILAPYEIKKVTALAEGGKERHHSVYAGLCALTGCDYVLIHDGARPLITEDIINRAVDGAINFEACVVGMPVKDTIKMIGADGFAVSTPDRSTLWQIQTPQAFSYPLIFAAYEKLMEEEKLQQGITDDAMVLQVCTGRRVKLIEGSYENLKITTPEDMVVAEALFLEKNIGKPLDKSRPIY